LEKLTTPEPRVILIDKPLEWTSFDVVKKLRSKLGIKKIGHAGTLDPLATGLLILCTGKMTKKIESIQAQEKEYEGSFTIGQTTPSFDLETKPTPPVSYNHIKNEDILNATKLYIGNITQTPPIYSAVKVNGKRAYESARAGVEIKLKTREVLINKFEITDINLPVIKFKVVCSKGTYIRSLANDFGKTLGVGAFLSALRRTRIGEFKISNALTIEEVE